MTLDETIECAEKFVEGFERIKRIKAVTLEEYARVEHHRQLAEWLKDYKRLLEQGKVMSDTANYEDIAKAFQLGLAFGFGEKHDEMDKVIEEIKKVITPQPKMEVNCDWIPVSERLPEENKTVIASTKYGVYPEAKYTKEYGWEWAYEAGADYWKGLEDVTAWMSLPERYKEESEVEDE